MKARGNGLIAVESRPRNPEDRGSIPRRSSALSIVAELLRSTFSLVLCLAIVTTALHVHCGLGQLGPLPTSGNDK